MGGILGTLAKQASKASKRTNVATRGTSEFMAFNAQIPKMSSKISFNDMNYRRMRIEDGKLKYIPDLEGKKKADDVNVDDKSDKRKVLLEDGKFEYITNEGKKKADDVNVDDKSDKTRVLLEDGKFEYITNWERKKKADDLSEKEKIEDDYVDEGFVDDDDLSSVAESKSYSDDKILKNARSYKASEFVKPQSSENDERGGKGEDSIYFHHPTSTVEKIVPRLPSAVESPCNVKGNSGQFTVMDVIAYGLLATSLLLFCCCCRYCYKCCKDDKTKTKKRTLRNVTFSQEPEVIPLEVLENELNPNAYPVRRLGNGAYGKVSELVGHDPPAVIKMMISTRWQHREAFEKEFEMLKQMKHRNVVCLLRMEWFEGDGRLGIVMELCQRGNLKETMYNPQIVYSMKTVTTWACQLLNALYYIFEFHNFVHRDIKPENIFVTTEFLLKIGDFGIAKRIQGTGPGTFIGTPRYMSPMQADDNEELQDQIDSENLQDSHRNDIYSLGLVFWELIERRPVLSEYEKNGSFSRDCFMCDIIQKKIVKLPDPNCQQDLQIGISRCSNFVRHARPTAVEALKELDLIVQAGFSIVVNH